jgi:hypothetical protein
MPSTVASILRAAGLETHGSVPWGSAVGSKVSGVYIVALSADVEASEGLHGHAPIDVARVQGWLDAVPKLTLDGRGRVTAEGLANRLSGFWLPDECVLYIGTTSQSLRNRVGAYYNTRLGNGRPHAGGHWVKVLQQGVLDSARVYFSETENWKQAELDLLDAFADATSVQSRKMLYDSTWVLPFANQERDHRQRKKHGIGRQTL